MADNNRTVFQRMGDALFGNRSISPDIASTPPATAGNTMTNRVLYQTTNKDDYERKLLQYKQQKYLSYQWEKARVENSNVNATNYTGVRLMYRDAELMGETPEIGSAIELYGEEACSATSDGRILNISSSSKRIKAILEELFGNRLNIHVTLPMIASSMCQYGNHYMLLNIDQSRGIIGWQSLPVYEMDRIENGYTSINTTVIPSIVTNLKPDRTVFVWNGHNGGNVYQDWQVAHFRLMKNNTFNPYGTSILHKARRAWRMWSMMEDAMLIYRLDKSVERRVFKVYVGAIDDQDVPAFIQEFANNFKRTPIIDPETGQVDLRKNILSQQDDFFIPTRDLSAPTPIETLPSANNPTAMDDIKYMQQKVMTALRIPKTFLNFTEPQGKGQNLSLLDVRFSRLINTIQQFLLLELNKIAMIHLHQLGLDDEITNFTLSLNNPSAQIEALELEDITKRIATAQQALADPGNGIQLMSMHMVLKKIMKMTDDEIKDMLNEIRLEKAMAAELQQTAMIIKKTGMFDTVDRIYGDYDALHGNTQAQQQQGDEIGGGTGGGPGGGPDMGGSLNMDSLGSAGSEGMPDMGGEEAEGGMEEAPDMDNGTPMESIKSRKPLLNEAKSFMEQYFEMLDNSARREGTYKENYQFDFETKNMALNEGATNILDKLDEIIEQTKLETGESGITEEDIDDFISDDED